jgi:hypothetical protein
MAILEIFVERSDTSFVHRSLRLCSGSVGTVLKAPERFISTHPPRRLANVLHGKWLSGDSMTAAIQKEFIPRSPRIRARPEKFSNYVRYSANGVDAVGRAAQFADVSSTGMRLISRLPARADVGDILRVEFTLPGSQARIQQQARVVRKINEFDFAIFFLATKDAQKQSLQEAITQHLSFLGWSSFLAPLHTLSHWIREHRQGLWLSLFALALGAVVGSWIFLNSDQHQGRTLRAWGKPHPKEWFWDYYKKTPPPSGQERQ